MGLSNDLISQFVKITKDTSKSKKETTVYGKIVNSSGTQYVQLDGSDVLTPIEATAEYKDGERVTVLIKNHTAIVTGNMTSPSVGSEKAGEIADDKIKNAKFDSAQITNLEATVAEISDARIKDAKIDTAQITNLSTEVANIADAQIGKAKIDTAQITNLSTEVANIADAQIGKATITTAQITDLNAKYANIDFANIGQAAFQNFFSNSGLIANAVVGEQTVTGELKGVIISGDLIKANTMKADRLLLKGEDGLYYKINVDALGEATASTDEKYQNGMDGSAIIANSITANKIAVSDLVAFGATIGGFHITENALYSGVKSSIDNSTSGIYLDSIGQSYFGDGVNHVKFFKDTTDNNNWKLEIKASKFEVSGSDEDLVEETKKAQEAANKAVISAIEQFYLSSSNTSLSGGSWSAVQPTWTEGKYIWRRTLVTFGNGDTAYSPSETGVCITGNTGKPGVSPTVSVSKSDGVTTISITDESGTHTQTVLDGANGTPGDLGSEGKTPYFHVKQSNGGGSTFTANSGETAGEYIGTCTTYTEADPTDVKAYSWAKIKGEKGDTGAQGIRGLQGPQGEQGIQGPAGKDGKTSYFHIKYSSVASPTSSRQRTETASTYIGTYVEYTETDSTEPKKDTWSRFEGAQGKKGDQGIAGTNGTNGKTSYLHIAYANSADGSTGFSVSDSSGKLYIGQYTDFTQSDSTDPKKYSWTKIKGETGAKGAKGDKGDTGAQGAGYTVLLTNENHTFAGSTSAAIAGSTSTNVVAYKNATQVAATITKIGSTSVSGNASGVATGVTGLTATVTNNGTTSCAITFNATTSLTTKNGSIAITMTVDSKTFTKNFSFALALTGARGGTGAAAITLDITSSNGSIFLNGTGSTVLTAHVYVGGVEQTVSDAGVVTNYGTVKWYKGTTYIKSSKTLTVSASDVVTEQAYLAQLEA